MKRWLHHLPHESDSGSVCALLLKPLKIEDRALSDKRGANQPVLLRILDLHRVHLHLLCF